MDETKDMLYRHSELIVFLLAFSFALFNPSSGQAAPTLPDAATPGGAFPRSLEKRAVITDDSDKLLIPRVIDRPLGVDEGARVKVREFIIKGAVSHPEHKIRKEDVAFIAEANRVKRQRLDEADMEGFTPEEVDDIAEFIRQLVEEPNQRPTSANLWKLVFKLRKSEWSRGLTMGQMQEVADEITRYYRQQGMILATAFIPAQDVVDGKVVIQILEGKLGKVIPEDNKMYSDKLLVRPFADLIGQPVFKDEIETGLLFLTDYPGLSVNGIFRPGGTQGETDLLIKTIDEKRINGAVSFDNNGSNLTGKNRARVDLMVNNPTGNADQLSLAVLQSFDPANGTFGYLTYSIPVTRSDWLAGFGFAHNQFQVEQDILGSGLTGKSTIGNGFVKKIFSRSRGLNSYALADFSRKKAVTNLAVVDVEDEYDVGKLEFGFDAIDTRFAGINVLSLQLYQGLGTRLGAAGFDDASMKGGFRKANLNFSRLQTIVRNFSLLLTTQFQYTDDRLNSLEQLPLGGADSVRAYPISSYLRDVGYFASFEFIVNAPGFADKRAFAGRLWGEIFSVSLFYDVGGGWLRGLSDNGEKHIQGAGAAVKLNLPGKLKVRVQVATRTDTDISFSYNDLAKYIDLAYYF